MEMKKETEEESRAKMVAHNLIKFKILQLRRNQFTLSSNVKQQCTSS